MALLKKQLGGKRAMWQVTTGAAVLAKDAREQQIANAVETLQLACAEVREMKSYYYRILSVPAQP